LNFLSNEGFQTMLRILLTACLFCFLSSVAFTSVGQAQDDPASAAANKLIQEKIDLGIKLIEEKKFEELIKAVASPEDIKKILERVTMEELVAGFRDRNATELLEVFKQVKGKTPTFNDAKDEATFKLDPAVGSHAEMKFRLIDSKWYLEN